MSKEECDKKFQEELKYQELLTTNLEVIKSEIFKLDSEIERMKEFPY